jgi:nudix-type nucleoside diphosphatase (YffH/AdpP family)
MAWQEDPMDKVEILSGPEKKYEGFFTITETRLRFRKHDGTMSRPVTRDNMERPDASAVLLYDRGQDVLILVRQFRYSVLVGGDGGWMTEIVAGTLDHGDDPEQAARREVMEETGYAVDELRHIFTFYPSPGGSSEKVYLYVTEVDESRREGEGGGAPDEEEDIEVLRVPVSEAMGMMDRGDIVDGKTLVALQWFRQRHRA